ncbi:MAG TPA: SRPBCC family protein [Acidimicrobiales bacterium]|nr:SRPBCC family protein [Acidimicrobiales bacterium]
MNPAGSPSGAFLSDRRYRFPADRAAVWAAIGSVDRYRAWWPWLRRFQAGDLAAGQVWDCQIQPPMPYLLRFTVTLQQVEAASLVEATIDGDVRGTARLDLADAAGGGCHVRLRSSLVPSNRTLRTVARVARPVAQFGHRWVLDTGARQFQARALRLPGGTGPGGDGEPGGDPDQALHRR